VSNYITYFIAQHTEGFGVAAIGGQGQKILRSLAARGMTSPDTQSMSTLWVAAAAAVTLEKDKLASVAHTTRRPVQACDLLPDLQAFDPGPDLLNNPGNLVTQDRRALHERKRALGSPQCSAIPTKFFSFFEAEPCGLADPGGTLRTRQCGRAPDQARVLAALPAPESGFRWGLWGTIVVSLVGCSRPNIQNGHTGLLQHHRPHG
jgi:hypothetical protein